MRTLCTGSCAKTKTHKEEGGVLGELSVCLHCLVLCTVALFLLFLSKLGVYLTTYLDFLELPLLFKYEKHIFPFYYIFIQLLKYIYYIYSVLNCSKVHWGLVL